MSKNLCLFLSVFFPPTMFVYWTGFVHLSIISCLQQKSIYKEPQELKVDPFSNHLYLVYSSFGLKVHAFQQSVVLADILLLFYAGSATAGSS